MALSNEQENWLKKIVSGEKNVKRVSEELPLL
jgi:hypothetical protein